MTAFRIPPTEGEILGFFSYPTSFVLRMLNDEVLQIAQDDPGQFRPAIAGAVARWWSKNGTYAHNQSAIILTDLAAESPLDQLVEEFEGLLCEHPDTKASERHWCDIQRMAQLCAVVSVSIPIAVLAES